MIFKIMNAEDKDLLLKDLCGRLPYGVKIKEEYGDYIDVNIHNANIEHLIDRVVSGLDKLVLRPMYSMTEEEKKEFIEYAGYEIEESLNGRHYEYYLKDFCGTPNNPSGNADSVDWLNKNMFDYRGLIPKGLADEAPDGMYNN